MFGLIPLFYRLPLAPKTSKSASKKDTYKDGQTHQSDYQNISIKNSKDLLGGIKSIQEISREIQESTKEAPTLSFPDRITINDTCWFQKTSALPASPIRSTRQLKPSHSAPDIGLGGLTPRGVKRTKKPAIVKHNFRYNFFFSVFFFFLLFLFFLCSCCSVV